MIDLKNKLYKVSTENEFRNKITLLSFICCVFVIYIHTYNISVLGIDYTFSGFPLKVYNVEIIGELLVEIAVPYFFFISGLLFFRTFEISNLFEKWRSRVKTIVVPFVIWATIYYLYYVLCTNIPGLKNLMSGGAVDLSVKTWFFWLTKDVYVTLWFLQNLIIYIVLTPIIWLLFKEHIRYVPFGLVLLVFAEYLIRLDPYFLYPYSNGLGVYLIGAYLGMNCRKLIMCKSSLFSIVSIVYIAYLWKISFFNWNYPMMVMYIFAIWFAIDLVNLKDVRFPWWMNITFFIYVIHDLFLEAFEKILFHYLGTSPLVGLIDYLFMPIVVLCLVIIIANVLEKRMPFVWKILNGDRVRRR